MADLHFDGVSAGQSADQSYDGPIVQSDCSVTAQVQSGASSPFAITAVTSWAYVEVDPGELPGGGHRPPHPVKTWEPQGQSDGKSPLSLKSKQKVSVDVRFTCPPSPKHDGYQDTVVLRGLPGGDVTVTLDATVSGTFSNHTTGEGEIAILGESDLFEGVRGVSHSQGHGGVVGINDNPATDGSAGQGIFGDSRGSDGVLGISHAPGKAGVAGVNDEAVGNGLYGHAKLGNGVYGVSSASTHAGVVAINDGGGTGLLAQSNGYEAIHADTASDRVASIAAYNRGKGPALYGKGSSAAVLEGDVLVNGNITATGDIFLPAAHDCAEHFEVADAASLEPGTVLVIDGDGRLKPCASAYDRRVAGVVSGAGEYKPGLILGERAPASVPRAPVALIGRAYCKVDADQGAIEIGDLVTTSATPGHAMRASDGGRTHGAILGKAMRGLKSGRGLIPILIALQ